MSLLVRNLSPRSSLCRCVWCRDALLTLEVACDGCGAGYHADCASEASCCGVAGCRSELAPPRRTIFVPSGRTAPTRWPVRVVEPSYGWWAGWWTAAGLAMAAPFVMFSWTAPLRAASSVLGLWTYDLAIMVLMGLSLLPLIGVITMAVLRGDRRDVAAREVVADEDEPEAWGEDRRDDWRDWV